MTEEEAKAWIAERVSRETFDRLSDYADRLRAANNSQNLISAESLITVWRRHIVDSAQIHRFVPGGATCLDLGSGPGLPGLIIALLGDCEVLLVEPRRLRVEFMSSVIEGLGITNASLLPYRLEAASTRGVDVITARAVAPLQKLLPLAHRFSRSDTVWLLPKGRGAQRELEAVGETWQGDFRLEPSITDSEAAIIVARGVRPRSRS